jgi:hypothetical protein
MMKRLNYFKETKFDIVLLGSGISDVKELLYVVFLKYIIQNNSNAALWRRWFIKE